MEVPESPMVFTKWPSSFAGPVGDIVLEAEVSRFPHCFSLAQACFRSGSGAVVLRLLLATPDAGSEIA